MQRNFHRAALSKLFKLDFTYLFKNLYKFLNTKKTQQFVGLYYFFSEKISTNTESSGADEME